MNQSLKKLLAFFLIFMFIQLCEIYIMGGFYNQTIESKLASIVTGVFCGLAFLSIVLVNEID